MRPGWRFLTGAIAGLFLASPARADLEPPRKVAPRGPSDGVWVQATAVLPVPDGDVAVQYGELGGTRIRYLAVQGERRLDRHWAAGLAYGIGELRMAGAPDPTLHLVRLFANWTNGGRRVEVDGRAWGELLVADPGPTSEQLRLRGRVSVALPASLPGSPRLFVADEVFFVRGNGFTRNRWSAGLRTRPAPRLSVDVAYQRSDDADGAGQNVALLQTTFAFGRTRHR